MRLLTCLVVFLSTGLLWSQNDFITTWQTDNSGTSGATEITIPINAAYTYNYDVDWDNDGSFDEFGLSGAVTHDFGTAGTYSIGIQGTFPQFYFNNGGDREKILDVAAWGDIQWLSGERAFFGCSNLDITAMDTIDLSLATSMNKMFRACTNLNSPNVIAWDVSNITDMNALFRACPNFNQNIGNWNVGNNENFTYMFFEATDFNQDISGWNVSSATVMQIMFASTNDFNQDLSGWNVSGVTTMRSMFFDALSFDQDISGWDVGRVKDMDNMFYGANSFDQNLGDWNIDSVNTMIDMFEGVTLSSNNYDSTLMGWAAQNVWSGVTFSGGNSEYCQGESSRNSLTLNEGWTITDNGLNCLGQEFITTWKTDNPGTSGTTEITIPTNGTYDYDVDWDNDGIYDEFGLTGSVTHDFGSAGTQTIRIKGTFPRIYFNNVGDKDKILSVDQWGTIAWTSFQRAFRNCDSLVINASDVPDLSDVSNFNTMFNNCASISNEDFSGWDVSNVTNMSSMFSFSSFDGNLFGWDVSSVQNFSGMFYGTDFNGDISNWITTSAEDVENMFRGNSSFNQDVSGWNMSGVDDFSSMFNGCDAFNADVSGWNVSSGTDMGAMFQSCDLFDQDLGSWDVSGVTNFFAFLDGTAMSIPNYDSLLIGWSSLTLTSGLDFDAEDVRFCEGSEARDSIIANFGWNFDDGGQKCFDEDFVLTVKTDNAGTTGSTSFELPLLSSYTDVNIDWDNDGIYDDLNVSGTISHDYGVSGTFTINVLGNFEGLFFNNSGDKDKILTIEAWGDSEWNSGENAFYGCSNLEINAADTIQFFEMTSLSGMFRGCTALNGAFFGWNVSDATDMSFMFADCPNFNANLNSWSPDNAVSMESMFQNCTSLDQDFDGWSTDDVELLTNMFNGATLFDGDISSFTVDNVTDATGMLTGTSFQTFYDLVLNQWEADNVQSNVTFDVGFATYCHGEHAHDSLTSLFNWTINDGGLSCIANDALITTWKTDNPGTSNSSSITFPVYFNSSTNYDVDWDNDGVYDTLGINGSFTHDFGTPGTYTIRVKGWVPFVHFGDGGDKEKILSVDQWGDMAWTSSYESYYGCVNLQINATDAPNFSAISGFFRTFRGCTSLNSNINHWDVSHFGSFNSAFRDCDSLNQPFDNWDVSNVKTFSFMFLGADNFNQDISGWDVSSATGMESVLEDAVSFDQNLGAWNVENVTNFNDFLLGAGISTINYDSLLVGWSQLNLNTGLSFSAGSSQYCAGEEARDSIISQFGWSIDDAGLECSQLEHFVMTVKTDNSGTSSSTEMTIPTNGNLTYNYDVDWNNDGVFDSIGVTGDITHDFGTAGTYTIRIQGDFPSIYFNDGGDNVKVTDIQQWGAIQWGTMSRAFWGCTNLLISAEDEPDLSQVTTLDRMLRNCDQLVTGNLGDWDVSTIQSFHRTFESADRFNEDLSGWITTSATNMNRMFINAIDYNQDMSNWDVSNVSGFQYMFSGCDSINQDLSNWVTTSATNMSYMFVSANNFNGDVTTWNTSGVTSFLQMFSNAVSFDQDLSSWDISSLNNAANMFSNVTLSTSNYDNLLIGWGQQMALSGVSFSGGNSMYCAGEAYRDTLTLTYGWNITDGGPDDATAPIADLATLSDITSVCEVTSLTEPTATDNCAATVAVTSDAILPITEGTTIVTWTYDDGHGNTSTQTQNIIVDDITMPVPDLAILPDTLAECEITSLVAPTATDNCSAAVLVTNDAILPITTLGTTLVTWTYDDGNGNTVTQTQNVVLNDVTPPTASNPFTLSVTCLSDVPVPNGAFVTDEADNCIGTPTVTWSNDVSDGLSCPETITRTYRVTDAVGLFIDVYQTIIVNDDVSPVVDDASLQTITSYCPVTPNTPTATDNCAGSINAVPDVAFPISTDGTTTITWTFTDDCGNITTQSQDIVIEAIEIGTTFAPDGITIISENNDSGVTFQWIECHNNNAPIAGETNQNFTPTYGGDFAVVVTQGGCSDTSACISSSVGLYETIISELLLYPNPSNGDFRIDSEVPIISITMLDVSGRQVNIQTNLNTGEVQTESVSTGNYFLQVITAQSTHTLEVMIR